MLSKKSSRSKLLRTLRTQTLMKHKTTILILLALALTAPSYHETQSFTFNGYEHNITSVIQDRVVLDTEYGRYILRADNCRIVDTHNWCITNLTHDPVEFWPHEYEIVVEHENMCPECNAYGKACESNLECVDYCVNEVCRPERTWCGDGVCDEGEDCPQDCPEQQISESNQTTTNQTTTNESTTNTTQETTNQIQPEEAVEEENTTTQTLAQETQTSTQTVSEEPNYIAAGATMAVGIIALFAIIARHQKKKQEKPDLYSFK